MERLLVWLLSYVERSSPSGCRLIAVGIDGANAALLGALTSSPDDRFIIPGDNFTELLGLVEPVAQLTCDEAQFRM